MRRTDDHHHSSSSEAAIQSVGDLLCDALLDRELLSIIVDDSCQLGESRDPVYGNVANPSTPFNWEEMVSAHAVDSDGPDLHQRVVLLVEDHLEKTFSGLVIAVPL